MLATRRLVLKKEAAVRADYRTKRQIEEALDTPRPAGRILSDGQIDAMLGKL